MIHNTLQHYHAMEKFKKHNNVMILIPEQHTFWRHHICVCSYVFKISKEKNESIFYTDSLEHDTQHSLRQRIISLVSVDQVKKESAHLKNILQKLELEKWIRECDQNSTPAAAGSVNFSSS